MASSRLHFLKAYTLPPTKTSPRPITDSTPPLPSCKSFSTPHCFLSAKDYTVNAQEPRIHKSYSKPCDIVVSLLESSGLQARVLCFAGRGEIGKWDETSSPYLLEKHARRYSTRYLYKKDMTMVHMVTITGTYVRL
jgi:hypothetical protein